MWCEWQRDRQTLSDRQTRDVDRQTRDIVYKTVAGIARSPDLA